MNMNKIWILGSSNVDVTYECEKLPLEGHTVLAESCVIATGGKGANQAFAVAHFGAQVNFIGAVGDDNEGKTLLNALNSKNINTDCVYIAEEKSGNAIIAVNRNGANFIVVYPGANQCIPTDMDLNFANGDLLVAQLEISIDAVEQYFKLAKIKGTKTILNPSPYKDIPKEIYRNTDIIIANESEAFYLGGIEVSDAQTANNCAMEIAKKGPKDIIITLGSKGVFAKSDQSQYFNGYAVKVVDTQGAGDAFLGTFAAKYIKNGDIYSSIQFANAAGALAVTKKGSTQVSMPENSEIEKLIKGEQDE